MEFQVGDRVQLILDYPGNNGSLRIGDTGTVRYIDQFWNSFAVEWDKTIEDGHDCFGSCTDGHGWWVVPEAIELLDNITFEFSAEEFASLLGHD